MRDAPDDLITRTDYERALPLSSELLGAIDYYAHRKDEFWRLRIVGIDSCVLCNRAAVSTGLDDQCHLAGLPGCDHFGKVGRRAAAGRYNAVNQEVCVALIPENKGMCYLFSALDHARRKLLLLRYKLWRALCERVETDK